MTSQSTFLKGGLAAALLFAASAASAQSATYTGQGLNSNPDGFGGYDLNREICGVANGADAEGPYLLWVFTATGAKTATITILGVTYPMVKTGNGTFKYVSAWYSPTSLPGNASAVATGGSKKNNAQLTVSHGCRPFVAGAWCSPGFWKNAAAGAWSLVGSTKLDMFNTTVVPTFYATASPADPTLGLVLTTPGANTYGAAAGPFGLNAFNATGAYLSNRIPGYQYDDAVRQQGGSNACPIDHFGNFKSPQ